MGRSGDIRIGSTHPESHSPSSLKSHTEVEKQLSGSLPTGRSVSFIHPEFRTLSKLSLFKKIPHKTLQVMFSRVLRAV